MSAPTHTPGPWTIDTCMGSIFIVGPDNNSLAAVYVESDAQLISAAPDLLVALQNITQLGDAEGWHLSNTGRQILLRDALEAIARATGKESA